MEGKRDQSLLGRTLVGIGIAVAALAALCCVAPFLVAGLVAAVGLGFILKDSVLLGLLFVSLAVAALGYYFMRRARQA